MLRRVLIAMVLTVSLLNAGGCLSTKDSTTPSALKEASSTKDSASELLQYLDRYLSMREASKAIPNDDLVELRDRLAQAEKELADQQERVRKLQSEPDDFLAKLQSEAVKFFPESWRPMIAPLIGIGLVMWRNYRYKQAGASMARSIEKVKEIEGQVKTALSNPEVKAEMDKIQTGTAKKIVDVAQGKRCLLTRILHWVLP